MAACVRAPGADGGHVAGGRELIRGHWPPALCLYSQRRRPQARLSAQPGNHQLYADEGVVVEVAAAASEETAAVEQEGPASPAARAPQRGRLTRRAPQHLLDLPLGVGPLARRKYATWTSGTPNRRADSQ